MRSHRSILPILSLHWARWRFSRFNSFTRLHVSKEAHISHAVAELLNQPSSAEGRSNLVPLMIPPRWETKISKSISGRGIPREKNECQYGLVCRSKTPNLKIMAGQAATDGHRLHPNSVTSSSRRVLYRTKRSRKPWGDFVQNCKEYQKIKKTPA